MTDVPASTILAPRAAVHARPISVVVCFVPLPFAITLALAIVGEPSIALASDRDAGVDAARADAAPDPTGTTARPSSTPTDVASLDDSPSWQWRPILAGCLGVLFGAAIAAWHIRGRGRA